MGRGGIERYTGANAFLITDGLLCVISRYRKFPRYYTMYRAGGIFSSEPLPEIAADWRPLKNGTVLCISQ